MGLLDRVRDLFPVANTSANLIEYMRVLGYLDNENNARPVPERETDDSNFGQWYVGNYADGLEPADSTLYVDDVTIGPTL